jgi:hypothetical protein
MDTYKLIADCLARRRHWEERLLDLDYQQSELLARSHESLWRSRKVLNDTSQNVARPSPGGGGSAC